MKTIEIEDACARMFGYVSNMIVPNVHWGAGLHECDLLILNKSYYAYEIEIKISLGDLKKDLMKTHQHKSDLIKLLYYAVPDKLKKHAFTLLPENAGIIVCKLNIDNGMSEDRLGDYVFAKIEREATANKNCRKWTDSEVLNLGRLGVMRIWTLKRKLVENIYKSRQKTITSPT